MARNTDSKPIVTFTNGIITIGHWMLRMYSEILRRFTTRSGTNWSQMRLYYFNGELWNLDFLWFFFYFFGFFYFLFFYFLIIFLFDFFCGETAGTSKYRALFAVERFYNCFSKILIFRLFQILFIFSKFFISLILSNFPNSSNFFNFPVCFL